MTYQWDENNPLGYKNKMGEYKTAKELSFILSCLPKSKLRILDLGGGSGRFAFPLKKMGHDVTIVDLNQDAINAAKEKGIEKAYCINLNDFISSGFDVALGIEIFAFTKPAELLAKAHNLLIPGGVLIFTATNSGSWRFKVRSLRKNKSGYHDGMFVTEYKDLIKSSGFELVKTDGFYWMPFKVNSNNPLIPLINKLEIFFRLNKYLEQSPWLLFACKKIE